MVTKVFKLFTADILAWKSDFDHTLLFEQPPVNRESQARFLLVYIVVISCKSLHFFWRDQCATRKLYKATQRKQPHLIPIEIFKLASKSSSVFGSPRGA